KDQTNSVEITLRRASDLASNFRVVRLIFWRYARLLIDCVARLHKRFSDPPCSPAQALNLLSPNLPRSTTLEPMASGVKTEIVIPPSEVSRRSAVTHLGFPMRSLICSRMI